MGGKYTAHLDVRQNMGCILMITWIWGLGSLFGAFESLPSLQGWALLILGFALIAIAIGIWRAREWARWGAGLIAFLYCIGGIGRIIYEVTKDHGLGLLAGLPGVAAMGLIAWGAFQPATKKSFADAREAIARARTVPR